MTQLEQTQSTISRFVDRIKDSMGKHQPASLVEIRPISKRDIDMVVSKLNPMRSAATHRGRLRTQNEGKLTYLIAWKGGTPIGHGQIIWDGPLGSPKQHLDSQCPYIEDLWVVEEARSQGVGAAIIARMEAIAREKEYRRLGLSVGVENTPAIKLYERLGFATVGVPNFVLSGTVADANGDMHFWSEECQYMRKPL